MDFNGCKTLPHFWQESQLTCAMPPIYLLDLSTPVAGVNTLVGLWGWKLVWWLLFDLLDYVWNCVEPRYFPMLAEHCHYMSGTCYQVFQPLCPSSLLACCEPSLPVASVTGSTDNQRSGSCQDWLANKTPFFKGLLVSKTIFSVWLRPGWVLVSQAPSLIQPLPDDCCYFNIPWTSAWGEGIAAVFKHHHM